MNPLWPVFHDPAYQPALRERLAFHWQANLLMLRRPRDIVLFTVISFLPLVFLIGFQMLFPSLYEVSLDTANPSPDLARLVFTTLVTFMVFLIIQHFAFVAALNLTYVHHVRTALRRRGIPLCPRCAQLLPPHAPGSSCPECGAMESSARMNDSGRVTSNDDAAVPSPEVPRR